MTTTGSIAPNFHEGTRSEYLAQYIFSAFGTSVPVPYPEDSGIDLYCTLGERIGQRLHVENYYFVQIKSNKNDIIYKDEKSVEWLLSHKYPFVICCIDKKNGSVEIFQTLVLSSCFFSEQIASITLSMGSSESSFEITQNEGDLKLSIGPAILKFKLSKLENQKWTVQTKNILKSWIDLDQENINQKTMGVNCIRVPEKYHTNNPLKEAKSFKGNFKLNPDHQIKFYDIFFRMLSQIVNQVASERDISKFKIVSSFAGHFTSNSSIKDSWGIKLLAVAVNTGAKYCGLSDRVVLRKKDGTSDILISDIENQHKDEITTK